MVTSFMNSFEYVLFIAVGVAGIVAFWITLVSVFRKHAARGQRFLIAATLAVVCATLMVGLWPFYVIYRIGRRLVRAPASTTLTP